MGELVDKHPSGGYILEELHVGMTAEKVIAATEQRIQLFAEASDDFNPVHLDEAFAAKTAYPDRFEDVDMTEVTNRVTTAFLGKPLAEEIYACPNSFGGYQKIDTTSDGKVTYRASAQAFIQAVSGHVHLAVVTDGPVISQRNKIEALGLEKWISKFVVTSERGAEWHKPAPLAFRHLQEQFRKNHDQCVYVADNPLHCAALT